MKAVKAGNKKVVCSNPDSPFAYFAWPSITRLPDGALAMVTSGFRLRHVCPFGKSVICYSHDEGETWTPPTVVMDTPLDDRDSGITVFGNGRVILTSFNNTLDFQASCAKGDAPEDALIHAYLNVVRASGAEEKYLGSTYRISEDGGYTFGPIMRSPVTAPHGPCALQDGSLLYVGRRFSKDDSFDKGDVPYIECCLLGEDDQFHHVSYIENIYEEGTLLLSCEPHTFQLPDGRILVHIRVQGNCGDRRVFTVYQSVSADGGKTFSKPERLLEHGSPAHIIRHSSGVLISTYGYRLSPFGVRIMFSLDDGKTWQTDYVLDGSGESGDLGYPATVECSDGSLLTIWYENVGGKSAIVQKKWELPVLK